MDTETLNRLRAGDPSAFAALVKSHHPALLALARTIAGDTDAEEIVQNSWIRAYQAIAGFEGRAQIRTWLARITINESRQLLRQRHRQSRLQNPIPPGSANSTFDNRFTDSGGWQTPPTPWHNDSPDNLLMGEELAHCLARLLADMPVQQRALLEMRDISGLSFEEICNELDISPSNARVLLHRARRQLFQMVDHYQENGEC